MTISVTRQALLRPFIAAVLIHNLKQTFQNQKVTELKPQLPAVIPGADSNRPADASIHCHRVKQQPESVATTRPSPASFYKGLQNVHAIAKKQGINPKDTETRWTINNNNLVKELLAPWNKDEVTKAFNGFHTSLMNKQSDDIKPDVKNGINPTAIYASTVALSAMVNGGVRGKGKPNNYDATGHQLTEQDIDKVLSLIKGATWQTEFTPACRGITISSADALFVPSDKFITKDLTDTSNSASDQKSSSTLIPANTPVYILAQLNSCPGLSPEEDSWLAIWRPEFGLKFVKSRHIGLIDQEDIDKYSQIQSQDSSGALNMTLTDRVKEKNTFNRLSMGTPLPVSNNDVMMAKCTFEKRIVKAATSKLNLYRSILEKVTLSTVDKKGILDRQVQEVPLPLNNKNFLNQISNNMLKYPAELVTPEDNENRSFAWGEGIIGPYERGQDISTFIRKIMLPFGLALPRHSLDQVNQGKEIADSRTDGSSVEANYQALLTYGKPGIFISWGRGNNMVSLGSVSMAQLRELDENAANDAMKSGMNATDRIPLLALSPIALTTKDNDNKLLWHHSGRTAVYPVFREGPNSTFIREGRKLQFFNYFSDVRETTATPRPRQ